MKALVYDSHHFHTYSVSPLCQQLGVIQINLKKVPLTAEPSHQFPSLFSFNLSQFYSLFSVILNVQVPSCAVYV